MKRIIDAVNGMAITTDIMLRELRRSIIQARDDWWERSFENGEQFVDWFGSTYMGHLSSRDFQNWREMQSARSASLLVQNFSLHNYIRGIFNTISPKLITEAIGPLGDDGYEPSQLIRLLHRPSMVGTRANQVTFEWLSRPPEDITIDFFEDKDVAEFLYGFFNEAGNHPNHAAFQCVTQHLAP